MVSARCASSERQFSALLEEMTCEADDTVAESLVGCRGMRKRSLARSIGSISTKFGEDGGQFDRRRASRVLKPYARESRALTTEEECSEAKVNLLPRYIFFVREPKGSRKVGNILEIFFRDAQGFGRLDAGPRASFTNSRPPPTALDLGTIYFLFYVCMILCVLEKLGLVDQN